jgi:tetratricopeptide (TPR) repeat protein
MQQKLRLEEAVTWDRRALEADPNLADAHCNLASALAQQGRFVESLQSYRRGHELGSKRPDWRHPSAEWVRKAELRVALEAQLPALLEGKLPFADNAQRLECAQMCQTKKLSHAAARLYADAFAADPRLAEDLGAWHRYNAAACAALAAAGRGQDSSQLDEHERARMRTQALAWLRADLALHAKGLETGKPEDRVAVRDALREWQADSDLAGLRDAAALASLSAEEGNAFTQLWADVATLLLRAETE